MHGTDTSIGQHAQFYGVGLEKRHGEKTCSLLPCSAAIE